MSQEEMNHQEMSMKEDQEVTPTDMHDKKQPKESFVGTLLEYVEILVFAVCAVLILFTFCFRLCRVNGNSMNKTLIDGEMLITSQLVEPEKGDIIVFHMTSDTYKRFNEPLVKRIIATEGQTVRIDYIKGQVFVDDVLLDEPYISLMTSSGIDIGQWTQPPGHDFNYATGIFEATVPEGCLFVMGDNRNNSADSRSNEVGFVDERRVLGKVLLRLSPYTVFD